LVPWVESEYETIRPKAGDRLPTGPQQQYA
jgi:hypothetical protein